MLSSKEVPRDSRARHVGTSAQTRKTTPKVAALTIIIEVCVIYSRPLSPDEKRSRQVDRTELEDSRVAIVGVKDPLLRIEEHISDG